MPVFHPLKCSWEAYKMGEQSPKSIWTRNDIAGLECAYRKPIHRCATVEFGFLHTVLVMSRIPRLVQAEASHRCQRLGRSIYCTDRALVG
jgi:hypothetical protein